MLVFVANMVGGKCNSMIHILISIWRVCRYKCSIFYIESWCSFYIYIPDRCVRSKLSKRFWTKVTDNRKWFMIKYILFISVFTTVHTTVYTKKWCRYSKIYKFYSINPQMMGMLKHPLQTLNSQFHPPCLQVRRKQIFVGVPQELKKWYFPKTYLTL